MDGIGRLVYGAVILAVLIQLSNTSLSRAAAEREQRSLPAHHINKKGNGCSQWSGQFLQEAAAKLPYRNGQTSILLTNGNDSRTRKKETSKSGEVKNHVSV